MYDIWKMKAINELQMLSARRQALKNIPCQIEELELRMTAIRSPTADSTPAKSGGSGREEAYLNNIVARGDLNASKEKNEKTVACIDRALSALTREEKRLLECFYIFPERGVANRLAGEFGIDTKTVYKRNNAALLKFIKAMYIRIFQVPNTPAITEYCLGGDTAGEGSDFFTGNVLDARTGVQVAALRHQFDADQYTRQMYCLGKYYKDALIGIEANFDSYPIMELQRLGYPKQYVREVQDTYTGKTEKRFGFKTTSLTRPTIISRLIEIVREHCDTINDRETLEELLTIVRNEKGRIEAPQGGHDDCMMGLAIAHHIRDQVVFPSEVIEVSPQYRFDVEKYAQAQYDYGESLVVV